MLTLIIGGSASGKSQWAEKYVRGLEGPLVYLATMEVRDQESRIRIQRHRARRAGCGFLTLECPRDLAKAALPEGPNVLLEDLGNLFANEKFSPEGRDAEGVLEEILQLSGRCRHLTIVANEVFSGGSRYEGETLIYLREMAWLHRQIAARGDLVAEVVCGQPVFLKGQVLQE